MDIMETGPNRRAFLSTIAVASTGDLKLWAFYISVVLIGAKLSAFGVQYVAFRILTTNRIRAARA